MRILRVLPVLSVEAPWLLLLVSSEEPGSRYQLLFVPRPSLIVVIRVFVPFFRKVVFRDDENFDYRPRIAPSYS